MKLADLLKRKNNQFLNEMTEQKLYRMVTLDWFLIHLLNDTLTSSGEYDYLKPSGEDSYANGISFTRNIRFFRDDAHFGKENHDVIMVLDRNKLSQRYKIEPYSDENTIPIGADSVEQLKSKQAEEIIPAKSINNLSNYLIKVYIDYSSQGGATPSFEAVLSLIFISVIRHKKSKYYESQYYNTLKNFHGELSTTEIEQLEPLVLKFISANSELMDDFETTSYHYFASINMVWHDFVKDFIRSKTDLKFVGSINKVISSESPKTNYK